MCDYHKFMRERSLSAPGQVVANAAIRTVANTSLELATIIVIVKMGLGIDTFLNQSTPPVSIVEYGETKNIDPNIMHAGVNNMESMWTVITAIWRSE